MNKQYQFKTEAGREITIKLDLIKKTVELNNGTTIKNFAVGNFSCEQVKDENYLNAIKQAGMGNCAYILTTYNVNGQARPLPITKEIAEEINNLWNKYRKDKRNENY